LDNSVLVNLCFRLFWDAFIVRYEVRIGKQFVFCERLFTFGLLFIATMLFDQVLNVQDQILLNYLNIVILMINYYFV